MKCIYATIKVPWNAQADADRVKFINSLLHSSIELQRHATVDERQAPVNGWRANGYAFICVRTTLTGTEDLFRIVDEEGDKDGSLLTEDGVRLLKKDAVVTRVYAEIPRQDRYGAGSIGSWRPEENKIFVARMGFAVYERLDAAVKDRGDDGEADYWLQMAVPDKTLESIFERLPDA